MMDANKNGLVNFEEFVTAVRRSDPQWHTAEDEEKGAGDDGGKGDGACLQLVTDTTTPTTVSKNKWSLFSCRSSNTVRNAEEGPSTVGGAEEGHSASLIENTVSGPEIQGNDKGRTLQCLSAVSDVAILSAPIDCRNSDDSSIRVRVNVSTGVRHMRIGGAAAQLYNARELLCDDDVMDVTTLTESHPAWVQPPVSTRKSQIGSNGKSASAQGTWM
jgi:hypothetical protein